MANFHSLPVELLLRITGHVERDDLCNLRLTSSALDFIVAPTLYSQLTSFSGADSMSAKANLLDASEVARSSVRFFHLDMAWNFETLDLLGAMKA